MGKANHTPTVWYRQPWSKMATLAVIGIILLVVIIGGLMYTAWRTSPVRAIFNAADHARTNPGVYKVTTASGSDFEVATDGVLIRLDGVVDGVRLNAVASGKDIYLRSTMPLELLEMMTSTGKQLQGDWYEQSPRFFNGRWMHISSDELYKNTLGSVLVQCGISLRIAVSDADDSDSKQVLRDGYSLNQFISHQSSTNDGEESTYAFTVDKEKIRSFFDHIQQTDFGKQVLGCAHVADRLEGLDAETVFSATITQPDYILKSLTIKRDGKELVNVAADYSKKPTIVLPDEKIDLVHIIEGYKDLLENPPDIE